MKKMKERAIESLLAVLDGLGEGFDEVASNVENSKLGEAPD